MSHIEQRECRANLIEERPMSLKVRMIKEPFREFWLPRSQISYMRKERTIDWKMGADGPQYYIIFTLPEWLIEKEQLWDLVP